MTYEHLRHDQRGPVTLITIDRPERMNAIGPDAHAGLVTAWGRFMAPRLAHYSQMSIFLNSAPAFPLSARPVSLLYTSGA